MANQYYLDIDASDVLKRFNELKQTILSPDIQRKILHDTCVDTAKAVTTILARTIPKQYAVQQKFVRAGIGQWQDHSFGNINVFIPLKGTRGVIGETFKSRGKKGRPKRGRYKISAKILKGKYTQLPDKMEHQGGNPPFVGKGKIVYTRKYKKSAYPIVRVAGLGVPQMPLNQSEKDVTDQVIKKMSNRLDYHFKRYLHI